MPILASVHGITPASLLVLFGVLPLSMVIFYWVPPRFRGMVLSLTSFGYAALVQWNWLPMLFASVAGTYLCCHFMAHWRDQIVLRRILYGVAVFLNLGFFIVAGSTVQLRHSPMVLGGAVYPVMGIMLAGDYVRNPERLSQNFWDFSLNMIFFPKLLMGPLTLLEPEDYESLRTTKLSYSLLRTGGQKFVLGAVKTIVLGRSLLKLTETIQAYPKGEQSLLSGWMFLVAFGLAFYFILCGFSDMAQGAAQLYGFSLPDSFRHPYQARSITDFNGRFHMTWKNFVQKEVFHPLEQEKSNRLWSSLHLLVAGMVVGIWYGFTFNYALWGAYISVFLLVEQYWLKPYLMRLPKALRHCYTLLVVLLSFPIVVSDGLGESLRLYRVLFSWNGSVPFYNNRILYHIASNGLALLLALFFCTDVSSRLGEWLQTKWPTASKVGSAIASGGLALLLVILLV